MKLPYDAGFKGEQIPAAEVIQIGIKLKQFVENYRRYILIHTPNKVGSDPIEILNKLDVISHRMMTQQYQDLFDDITTVDQDDNSCPF